MRGAGAVTGLRLAPAYPPRPMAKGDLPRSAAVGQRRQAGPRTRHAGAAGERASDDGAAGAGPHAGSGLLCWQRRLVRCGWRTEQTSNAYTLLTPQNATTFPPARCDAQTARPAKPKTTLSPSTAPWRGFPTPQPPRMTVAEQLAFCLTGQVPA
jgi:hypothetical protein